MTQLLICKMRVTKCESISIEKSRALSCRDQRAYNVIFLSKIYSFLPF